MRKKLLLILLCLPMIGFGQQTYVPDDNFEAYLEANLMGNGTPNDNYVTSADIANVDELLIWSQNISDLTGIKDFTALEYLHCDNNNLTFLDLSYNLLLEEVDCSNNNLTSLVLGSNTSLEEVNCSNNQISSLDFSNYPDFKRLEAENNALVSLNLRNGNNGSFYGVKLLNNPLLTCIEVDDANESYSDWTGSNYSFDTQHYFHGIISYGWVEAAIFPPTSAGGNPNIEMYYVNSMSIDINSYGEPAIAFDGVPWPPYLAMMTGMQVVLKYDNNLHAWDTIASPVDGSLFPLIQEEWYLPIIRFNSDDQPFINYLEEISVGGAYGYTVKLQQGDSSLCGSTVSVPEINTHLAVNTNKKLIKTIDILGRETKANKNQPLFYIYDDGTVEKRIIIE